MACVTQKMIHVDCSCNKKVHAKPIKIKNFVIDTIMTIIANEAAEPAES